MSSVSASNPPATMVNMPAPIPPVKRKKLSYIYDAYGLSGSGNKGENALYGARFVPILNLLPVGACALTSVAAMNTALAGYRAGDHKDPDLAKDLNDQLKFSLLTGAQAANIFFGNAGALVAIEVLLTLRRIRDAKEGIS